MQVADAYLAIATLVVTKAIPPTSPDPDDDVVLATAIASKADLLVSGDQHLLKLQQFQGILICNTAQALALLP